MPELSPLIRALVTRLDTLWVAAGTGARALGQLLFTWILVRTHGPEGVGIYGVAVAWAVPITSFASLQLARIQATDTDETFSFQEYLGLRYITSALSLIGILCLLPFTNEKTSGAILGMGILLTVSFVSEIFQNRLLQRNAIGEFGKSLFIVNAGIWFTSAACLAATGSISVSFLSGALAGLLLTMLRVKPAVNRAEPDNPDISWLPGHADASSLAALARIAFPLGVGLLLDSLATQVPRFVLDRYRGLTDLGVFVGLLAFLSVGVLTIETVSQPLTPRIASLVSRNNQKEIGRLLSRTLLFLAVSIVVLAPISYIVGPPIASAVLGPAYRESGKVLAILAAVFCLQFALRVFSTALAAIKWTRQDMSVHLVSLVTAVIVAVPLISRFGVTGAALALLCLNSARTGLVAYYVLVVRNRADRHDEQDPDSLPDVCP